jgi:hypothetical protein
MVFLDRKTVSTGKGKETTMELENAITYWTIAKKEANELALRLYQTYQNIANRIQDGCGQRFDREWIFSHSIENETVEVSIVVGPDGVRVSYIFAAWTRWSAMLPDDLNSNWTCTLNQLERVCATLKEAADCVEEEIENMAIDVLLGCETTGKSHVHMSA